MTATFTLTGDLRALVGSGAPRSAYVQLDRPVVDVTNDVTYETADRVTVQAKFSLDGLPAKDALNNGNGDFNLYITIGERKWLVPAQAAGTTHDLTAFPETTAFVPVGQNQFLTIQGLAAQVAADRAATEDAAAEVAGAVDANDSLMTTVASDPGSDFRGALGDAFVSMARPPVGSPTVDTASVLAARDRGIRLHPGVYEINATIDVEEFGSLLGVWSGVGFSPTTPTGGTVLKWVGAAGGTVVRVFGQQFVEIDGICIDGGGIDDMTGLLIDSDNMPATRNLQLGKISIVRCGNPAVPNGVGMQIGTSGTSDYQSDAITIERFELNYNGTGLHALSGNALSICEIRSGTCYENNVGIFIEEGGPITMKNVAFGGGQGPAPAHIHLATQSPMSLENCQGEDHTATADFLRVTGSASFAGPISLQSCIINRPIDIQATRRIVSIGNFYTNDMLLTADNSLVVSIQDAFLGAADLVAVGTGVQIQRLTPRGSSPAMETVSNFEGVVHRFRAGGAGGNPSVELKNDASGGGQWYVLFPGDGGIVPGALIFRNNNVNPLILGPGNALGFFGAAPVAKPTGVPVTAADIHAALVALGLIGA